MLRLRIDPAQRMQQPRCRERSMYFACAQQMRNATLLHELAQPRRLLRSGGRTYSGRQLTRWGPQVEARIRRARDSRSHVANENAPPIR